MLSNIGRQLIRVMQIAMGIALLGAVLLNFANVVGRYVFLRPIIWAEEIMVYAMIWMIMLGAGIASWDRTHLRMEAVHDALPPTIQRVIEIAIGATGVAVGAYVVYLSLGVMQIMLAGNQKSVAAGLPMVVPFAAVPLGFGVIVIASLIRIFRPGRTVRDTLPDQPML